MKNREGMVRRLVSVSPWVLLAGVAVYFLVLGGWRDVTAGRFHRKAIELFTDIDGVTKVEVFRLLGKESELGSETFPIRPYDREDPTYGMVILEGEALEPFLKTWRFQEASYWRQAACHGPVYGFRLFRGQKLVAETSICWECSNYWVTPWPGTSIWYGFVADGERGQELLRYCDSLLPYRRADVEVEDKSRGSAEP